jgi:H+/Cl- antiporter ClcA
MPVRLTPRLPARMRSVVMTVILGRAVAFSTPIAAVTFALEEIIRDLNHRMPGSVLLAAVT